MNATTEGATMKVPQEGQRIRLRKVVERYPHFRVDEGATGTIEEVQEDYLISAKMDDHIPCCEDWDNEIVWCDADYEYFAEDALVV